MATVLLVEDDADLDDANAEILTEEGFLVAIEIERLIGMLRRYGC